jgi:hypothetical protein
MPFVSVIKFRKLVLKKGKTRRKKKGKKKKKRRRNSVQTATTRGNRGSRPPIGHPDRCELK